MLVLDLSDFKHFPRYSW